MQHCIRFFFDRRVSKASSSLLSVPDIDDNASIIRCAFPSQTVFSIAAGISSPKVCCEETGKILVDCRHLRELFRSSKKSVDYFKCIVLVKNGSLADSVFSTHLTRLARIVVGRCSVVRADHHNSCRMRA